MPISKRAVTWQGVLFRLEVHFHLKDLYLMFFVPLNKEEQSFSSGKIHIKSTPPPHLVSKYLVSSNNTHDSFY